MKYIELSASKYMHDVMKQEQRRIRQARNAKAINDFVTFLFGLGAIYVGILAVQNMDLWRPYVEKALQATGLF